MRMSIRLSSGVRIAHVSVPRLIVYADFLVEEDGVQSSLTVIVARTGERVVGLTDLESYRRVVEGGGPAAQAPQEAAG